MDIQTKDGILLRGIPDGTPDEEIKARIEKIRGSKESKAAPAEKIAEPSDTSVGFNAANKALAGIPDALLNTPANIMNLGKAAFGMGAHAVGRPDLAPDVEDPPNLINKAMRSGGLIRDDAEPVNGRQRIIDTMVQGGVGAMVNPAGSIKQLATNAATGVIGGTAGGVTKEVTGDENLALSASMASPLLANAVRARAQTKVADLQKQKMQNEVEDATLAAGREKGYVVPPADVNGEGMKGFVNKRLTSIAGKAATKQEATNKNQTATNEAMAEELGFPKGTALSEAKLNQFRDSVSGPYREVAAISPAAESALEKLKVARAEAKNWHRHYDVAAHPDSLKAAEAADAKAQMLETALEKMATRANKPELVNELREARTQIAKSYDVERGLNLGSGDIAAGAMGKALDKGAKLSGNLETTAKFQQAFPQYTGEAAKTPTPGVSKMEAVTAALMAGGGAAAFGPVGAVAGAAPLVSGPVRSLILSKPYQKFMAQRDYSPGALDKLMSELPPNTPPEVAMQALMMSRAIAERQQGAQ